MANSKSQVKVNSPSSGKNADVEVLHLGMFKNGSTVSVSDEQVAHWEAQTGQKWPKDGMLYAPSENPGEPVEFPKGAVLETDTGLPVVPPSKSKDGDT